MEVSHINLMELSNGSTSRSDLATACSNGDYDRARELLAIGSDPITSRAGYFSWSPLHFTAQQGELEFAQVLISQYGCHPQVEDKEGRTPLHIACQHGNLDFVQYLIKQKRCDASYLDVEDQSPLHHACGSLSECTDQEALRITKYLVNSAKCDPNQRDKNGMNGLLHASEKGFLSVLKFFVEECGCDLSVVDYRGNNALHLAVSFSKDYDTVKYILSKEVIDLGNVNNKNNNVLHMAVIANSSLEIFNLILDSSKSDSFTEARNEDNLIPLDLAKPELFRSMVTRFQVKTEKFYDKYIISLGIKPLRSHRVKIYVVGDSGAGKTTLIRTLQKESSPFISSFSLSFSHHSLSSPTPVSDEGKGLEVTQFNSKIYGNVSFYNFAGHSDCRSLQEAFLQALILPTFNIFVVVIDFSKSPQEINLSLHQWLSFLSRSWRNLTEVPNILIVGTHADVTKSNGKLPKETLKSISLENFVSCVGNYAIIDTILVDCHRSDHGGIVSLRKELSVLCNQVHDKIPVSFNASCLLTLINNTLLSSLAISLETLITGIKSYSPETGTVCDVRYFLSHDITILTELVRELESAGYVLFLRDEADVKKSLVCVDVSGVFAELANIYTNSQYQQALINKRNLVSLSNFSLFFPDVDVIVFLLLHLKLAIQLDTNVRELTTNQKDLDTMFYLPGVISRTAPKGTWDSRPHYQYSFGWTLEFGGTCRLSFRTLHVMLLKCFSAAMSIINFDGLSLWKNGIFFSSNTEEMFEVIIEALIDMKCIFVLLRAPKQSSSSLKVRSSIIRTIRECSKEICLYTKPVELIMDPFDSEQYPLQSRRNLTLFEVSEAMSSIVSGNPTVKSTCHVVIPLNKILKLEPLVFLGRECLRTLSEVNPSGIVSDSFLRSMAEAVSSNSDQFNLFSSILSLSQCEANSDALYSHLLSWKKNDHQTYHDLIFLIEQVSLIDVCDLTGPT